MAPLTVILSDELDFRSGGGRFGVGVGAVVDDEFGFLLFVNLFSRKMMMPMTEEPPTIDPMEMLIFTFTVGPGEPEEEKTRT